jgi:lipopolysaccharide biosynthesis glycosyltransferase
MKTALVFSADENFALLARGLVLSLQRLDLSHFDCFLIDIGCSAETLDWMGSNKVSIRRFSMLEVIGQKLGDHLKPYQYAQLCRPFIRQIVPDYDVYIWCDADIWLQDADTLRAYEAAAGSSRGKIVLSAFIDDSYTVTKSDPDKYIGYAFRWYAGCYGPTLAKTYCDKPILNSGLFALHKSSKIWEKWAQELIHAHKRAITDPHTNHLAEQTVLNYICYSENLFVEVDALHNYNCHEGTAIRLDGVVVVDDPLYRKIGAIHLTQSAAFMKRYLDDGLLFDEGRYLTSAERSTLLSTRHYTDMRETGAPGAGQRLLKMR